MSMKLTKKQKELEKKFWVKFYINQDWFLEMKTSNKYEKYLIEESFNKTLTQITAWYSQAEIDTWNTKVDEAKIVVAWWTSDLLNALVIEWETVLELAKNILAKASEYSQIYLHAEKIKREELKKLENNII